MLNKYEIGDRVVCIKEYETLNISSHYPIKGSGDLGWNCSTNKKGYGFCIEDDKSKELKFYYFTIKEMDEYFITEREDYKMYMRDQKIKEILK